MEFRLKALTPVWTGGVDGKNDKLHVTGIKGSIRWWYEVLIRGLGCYACDPTANGHCELEPKELNRDKPLSEQVKEQICPACYMFGCTGWSGKFILRLMESETNKPIQFLSSREIAFKLHFLEQKKIDPEGKLLFEMTLKLIVDYGAVGGKTTFKPSEVKYKNTKLHHRDFGLIERGDNSNLRTERLFREDIHKYLEPFKENAKANNKENDAEWPNLKNFWFVKGDYIKRNEHNQIVNRCISEGVYDNPDSFRIFLGGFIKREKESREDLPFPACDSSSKKIFSFHGIDPENKNLVIKGIRRCFGYVKENELDKVIELIEKTSVSLKGEIKRGTEVLNEL